MQAIILAGGLGTRLKSVVSDKPKVLSPVAGKPFLYYIIQYLQEQGVTSYIFSLGYLANQVIDFLQEDYSNLPYQYYIEDIPLGTGGGIKKAIELSTVQDVLIVNADTYFNISLSQMYAAHKATDAMCSVSLKLMNDFDRYGSVEIDINNTIILFKEKKYYAEGLINGGVYALNANHFLALPLPAVFSFEKDYLEKYYTKQKIYALVQDEYFIDIGVREDLEKANRDFGNR